MKILYLSNSYPPYVSGTAIIAGRVAGWMGKKHNVSVICPSDSRKMVDEKIDGTRVHRLPSMPVVIRKDYRLIIPNKRSIEWVFRTSQPDVVHVYDPSPASLLLLKLAKNQGVPVVVSHFFVPQFIFEYLPVAREIASKAAEDPTSNVVLKSIVKLYNGARLIVVLTDTVKELLQQVTTIPINIISAGVDLKQFGTVSVRSARASFKKHHLPNLSSVMYAGRMDQDKNLEVLLASWQLVSLRRPDLHLIMVGDGKMKKKLVKLAEKLGVTNTITWTGLVSQDELPGLYHNPWVKLFMISSKVETQSMVTLQALASGVPVVAADSGALPELVQAGRTGALCVPDDPSSYAKAIVELISDEQMRKKMAKKARRVARHHDWRQSQRAYFELYEDCVSLT